MINHNQEIEKKKDSKVKNIKFVCLLLVVVVGCNDTTSVSSDPDGSIVMDMDGSVPMMDGTIPEVDAGVDSGSTVVDAGPTDVNQCLTNNGGCSTNPMVTCINNNDVVNPARSSCGSCPSGYSGDGKTCTLIPTWLCAMHVNPLSAYQGTTPCDASAGEIAYTDRTSAVQLLNNIPDIGVFSNHPQPEAPGNVLAVNYDNNGSINQFRVSACVVSGEMPIFNHIVVAETRFWHCVQLP